MTLLTLTFSILQTFTTIIVSLSKLVNVPNRSTPGKIKIGVIFAGINF